MCTGQGEISAVIGVTWVHAGITRTAFWHSATLAKVGNPCESLRVRRGPAFGEIPSASGEHPIVEGKVFPKRDHQDKSRLIEERGGWLW